MVDFVIRSLVGICLAIVSSLMFTGSAILQKIAVLSMEEISMNNIKRSVVAMFRNRKWMVGLIMGNLGGLPYFFAIWLAGVSIVEPLINFGFILLPIAAIKIFKEHLRLWDLLAIILLASMPVFLYLSKISPPTKMLSDFAVFQSFIGAGILLLAILGILLLFSKKYVMLLNAGVSLLISLGTVSLQACLSFIEATGYDLWADFPLLLAQLFSNPYLLWALGMASISIVFYTVSTYFFQIALQKIPASKCVPIVQTLDNFFTISIGILIFGQLVAFWYWYIVALVVSVFGTWILGKYQQIIKSN